MLRKSTSLAAAIALVVALIPAPTTQAVNSEIHYTVRYVCICGPICYGWIVGEWTRACDGSYYGWGVPAYDPDPCYNTEVSYGDICED